ncbi:MAG: homoserine dehydrogenase [Methylacidiphilales bacterium]|nr:homoserine dehydrogenase [Candidatus Methylacidiphilales bacterium]
MSDIRIGIAILGFGTVGQGVYSVLQQKSKSQGKHGALFEVVRILARNPKQEKFRNIPKNLITTDFAEILKDERIDVVIEVMGGTDPALKYVQDALAQGKHVITANKEIMGKSGKKLVERARAHERFFGYAATVTGCHQLCSAVGSSMAVERIVGIFNGTSNYILSRMEEGLSQPEALAEAQAKGYAELDPSSDIDGLDARNKLVIMSKLAFGLFLDRDQIDVQGIRSVTLDDMEYAKGLGYVIKLLGVSELLPDGRLDARVHPALVPAHSLLASVKGVGNGIVVEDRLRGVQGLVAEGAGSRPTAMAIYTDLIALAEGRAILWPQEPHELRGEKTRYLPRRQAEGRFYLGVELGNNPGALAELTKLIARRGINIASILQRDLAENKMLPVVVLTDQAKVRDVDTLVEDLRSNKVVGRIQLIRVEEPGLGGNRTMEGSIALAAR